MKIHLRYIKERDLFEMQLMEPHLKSQFLLSRKLLNDLRTMIERALIETKAENP